MQVFKADKPLDVREVVKMKKELTKRLLFELLKDSKRSDRELAQVLGVSQPTVTRRRNQLVEQGIIRDFAVIPDFAKMGYEIMAISCIKTKNPVNAGIVREAKEWMMQFPNIIFVAYAHGMGKNGVMISLHKNYAAYSRFVTAQLEHWRPDIESHDSMLISLKGMIAKPFSLKYLADERTAKE